MEDVLGNMVKIIKEFGIQIHESVNKDKIPPMFGDVKLKFHWPPYTQEGQYDKENQNNNSVVLELDYQNKRVFLTGDCEAKNWNEILAHTDMKRVKIFQAPHHGAKNGMFAGRKTPWLNKIGITTKIALSSHISPHKHPNKNVIEVIEAKNQPHYRTDQHYHLIFKLEDNKLNVKWSH
jgi:beta-lactamase superfamily II metal-dependent hydrolase